MCFVVGALRRAMLIHARVVLSADDFYGRKSDQSLFPSIFFFFYIYLFFVVILFVLFGKKRRFSFRSEDRGICIISPRTAASLVFSFFQCLLISFYLAHYTYISLSLSLSLFFSLTVYLLFGNTICCTSCLCCSAERGSHAM